MYGASSVPSGWLACDGSTKNIASYPGLAAVLGTSFGGDGVTTFGLPDLRGRVPVGLGTGTASDATAWSLGTETGTEGHTLTSTEIPAHVHTLSGSAGWSAASGQWQNGPQSAGVYPIATGLGTSNSGSVGGGGSHENRQPSIGLQFLIKT